MEKKIVLAAIVLLALIFLIGCIPFSHQVTIRETAMEYSLHTEDTAIPHEVRIEGTYCTSLILKDSFWGKFYISDVEGLTEDMRVEFFFDPESRHYPVFLGEAGQPHSAEAAVVFFDRNFEALAVQFAAEYERTEDHLTFSCSDSDGNFLVLGAQSRDQALAVYEKLLKEKGNGGFL